MQLSIKLLSVMKDIVKTKINIIDKARIFLAFFFRILIGGR